MTSPASTDATLPAASEPAKGKGLKARSAELDAEIAGLRDKLKTRAALREELHALTRPLPDASAASSPAPAGPSADDAIRTPDLSRPMLSEQEFFTRFPEAAYGQYSVYATRYLLAEDRAQQQQQAHTQTLHQKWNANVEAVRAEHPDYELQMHNLERLPSSPAQDAIAAALRESGNARVLYHLATHLDEAARLNTMAPWEALVELGKLDAQIGNPTAARLVPNTVTQAPPPPPSLTARAALPNDEIEQARRAGDWRRWKQLMNEKDIAAAARR